MAGGATLHIDGDAGLWRQILTPTAAGPPRAALFLDRDGVIVEEVHYLHRTADMRLIPGAIATIRAVNDCRVPVVLVTNQSGVGRGLYGWEDFAAVQNALDEELAAAGAHLDMVLACAYHADAQAPYAVADHPWRKPRPGMLIAAAAALSLDLSRSWIVGDTASDIAAGRNAGLAGGVHVLSGHGRRERDAAKALATANFPIRAAPAIGGVLDLLPPLFRSCSG